MEKVNVGISMGDINGVGLEVILKTLAAESIQKMCTPIIYGSSKVVSYHKNILTDLDFQFNNIRPGDRFRDDKINVVNCWQENVKLELGCLTEDGGKYAYMSLDAATRDLKEGTIDALVTAPINKKAMQLANFPYTGHTEYLTKSFEVTESLMLMISGNLRVGLVTNHLPISEVAASVTREKIISKLRVFHDTLKKDFGIEKPIIAILGLNPHAGDEGLIGDEEENIIRPIIIESKKKGMLVMGPFPADGFFGSANYKKYDGILAMYHDQGLVGFKALSFGSGVNFTAGLPAVRTSPDHGTAYDIAGKGLADPSSFRQALYLAIDVARNRKDYTEMHANPIKKKAKQSEEKNA